MSLKLGPRQVVPFLCFFNFKPAPQRGLLGPSCRRTLWGWDHHRRSPAGDHWRVHHSSSKIGCRLKSGHSNGPGGTCEPGTHCLDFLRLKTLFWDRNVSSMIFCDACFQICTTLWLPYGQSNCHGMCLEAKPTLYRFHQIPLQRAEDLGFENFTSTAQHLTVDACCAWCWILFLSWAAIAAPTLSPSSCKDNTTTNCESNATGRIAKQIGLFISCYQQLVVLTLCTHVKLGVLDFNQSSRRQPLVPNSGKNSRDPWKQGSVGSIGYIGNIGSIVSRCRG